MAHLKRFPVIYPCIFCVRRVANKDISNFTLPFKRQIRGKKRNARESKTVTVKLLQDMVGYGPQGSIVPMVPGRMRNQLYPKQLAAYVTKTEIREFQKQGIIIKRDAGFGIEKAEKEEEFPVKAEEHSTVGSKRVADMKLELLSPERATEIISTSIPQLLVFFRRPTPTPASSASQGEPSNRSFGRQPNSATADLVAASVPPPKPQPISVFGSVSTADIVDSIKAILSETSEGGRVVLGPEDVKIIRKNELEGDSDVGADRVKVLGDFEVNILAKGGSAIRRTVSVRAQEV